MKKFINHPDKFVDEMLEGILLANPDILKSARDDNRAIVRKDSPIKNKVAVVTGGGSGHLPLFMGYIGEGMLDGASIGNVFAASSIQQMLDVTRAVDGGKGVLYVYGNYDGDVMNFDMAAELAEAEGITVKSVVGNDDVASMPKEMADRRRGVAGIFFIYKIAGAKAETGACLEEVEAIAKDVKQSVKSMGVSLSPCIIPEVGSPNFSISEGFMEVGMGIHGEPGIRTEEIKPADEITETIIDLLLEDYDDRDSVKEVSLLINGLGSTPLEELYIIYRSAHRYLESKGIKIYKSFVGEYATSLEMAGMSISILNMKDEFKPYLDMPFKTAFHVQK